MEYHFVEYTDSEGNWVPYQIFMGIFAWMCVIVIVVFLYHAYLTIRMYKLQNMWLILFLLTLFLSQISDILYALSEVVESEYRWLREEENNRCSYILLNWLSFAFNLLTVMINLFNWIFQMYKIDDRIKRKVSSTQKIWTILLILVFFFISIFMIYFTMRWFNLGNHLKFERYFGYTFSTAYIIIGTSFAFLGQRFIKKFKIISPNLAKKASTRVMTTATIIWSIFVFRGIFLIARSSNNFLEPFRKSSLKNGNLKYPIFEFCYCITVSLVPTIMHIMMLRYLISHYTVTVTRFTDEGYEVESSSSGLLVEDTDEYTSGTESQYLQPFTNLSR